jgi:hypothetical protein
MAGWLSLGGWGYYRPPCSRRLCQVLAHIAWMTQWLAESSVVFTTTCTAVVEHLFTFWKVVGLSPTPRELSPGCRGTPALCGRLAAPTWSHYQVCQESVKLYWGLGGTPGRWHRGPNIVYTQVGPCAPTPHMLVPPALRCVGWTSCR